MLGHLFMGLQVAGLKAEGLEGLELGLDEFKSAERQLWQEFLERLLDGVRGDFRSIWEFPKMGGTLFWGGPYNKNPTL